MANGAIGVKGWRNYSTFSLFGGASQRADRQTSILVDTYSGNLSVLSTDWLLASRIPCVLERSYNHQDSTGTVDRPFGPGWFWAYDQCLTGNMTGSGNVTWKAADGSEYEFTYSAGPVWAAPAGMHEYKLTFSSTPNPDEYYLSVGKLKYTFVVNTTDGIARLVRIEDLNGNALNIVRVYSTGKPTFEIDKIQSEYDNSGPTTHDLVDITYTGTLITGLRLLDTDVSGDFIDLIYGYDNIDSEDRLTSVEPQFNSVSIDMEIEYGYDAGTGLELTGIADTRGVQDGYAWAIAYDTGKVETVTFPIDDTPTTGVVTYAYNTAEPTDWDNGNPDQ